ncbi:unnamed protein product, partial [Pylaiella littoralis]
HEASSDQAVCHYSEREARHAASKACWHILMKQASNQERVALSVSNDSSRGSSQPSGAPTCGVRSTTGVPVLCLWFDFTAHLVYTLAVGAASSQAVAAVAASSTTAAGAGAGA